MLYSQVEFKRQMNSSGVSLPPFVAGLILFSAVSLCIPGHVSVSDDQRDIQRGELFKKTVIDWKTHLERTSSSYSNGGKKMSTCSVLPGAMIVMSSRIISFCRTFGRWN